MLRIASLFLLLFSMNTAFAQNKVAITIDDAPNTVDFMANGFMSPLMKTTDSLKIPVALFINESKIYSTPAAVENFTLLSQWIKKDYVTPGNHTYSHPRYSNTSLERYKEDIIRGESITRPLAGQAGKELRHFRFPFNDLGADSIQHQALSTFLESRGYSITPFTIESSDWMYSYLYDHYLKKGNNKEAGRIAAAYVKHTLDLFDYFEKLTKELYKRPISHIYLCHDNNLNAKSLPVLIAKLKERKYSFISLDSALEDKVYQSKDYYKGKWGFSWLYRWMEDPTKRNAAMRKEPAMTEIEKEYERVVKENGQ